MRILRWTGVCVGVKVRILIGFEFGQSGSLDGSVFGHIDPTCSANQRVAEPDFSRHSSLNGNAAVIKVLAEEGGTDTQLRNARGHTALDTCM